MLLKLGSVVSVFLVGLQVELVEAGHVNHFL